MAELIVAFSGGKDSTAMALRLHELGERFRLLFTPTGNEFDEVFAHVRRIKGMTGAELILPGKHSLQSCIREQNMIPNFRARFCTRIIKVEPCQRWLVANPGKTLCVGLRADEMQRAGGIYGPICEYREPLKEWDWGLKEVVGYLAERGIEVPRRTDCKLCFYQRLHEWWTLWKDDPEGYAEGERLEAEFGHTFRSPGRDTWPASLAELRKEFEAGRVPKQRKSPRQKQMEGGQCRVCSM